MHQIAIVYKNADKATSLANNLAERLSSNGYEIILEASPNTKVKKINKTNFIPDLVISLGGDGTLLYAARAFGLQGTPLLGVNLGQLGFLAELEVKTLHEQLDKILQGQFEVEKRMTLQIEIISDSKKESFVVLNDAVINKNALAKMLRLEVSASTRGSWRYRADGLIISTPTGSTAYNLSAGGPIIYPSLPVNVITPICPFSLSSRPLILPMDFELKIETSPIDTDAYLTCDGQKSSILDGRQKVIIKKSEQIVNLIINPKRRFLNILRKKLGWLGDTRI